MNSIVQTLLSFQIQLKTYHWQTINYSRHKATDSLGIFMAGAIDLFVETMQGRMDKRVKFSAPKNVIQLKNFSDKSGERLLKTFCKWLENDLTPAIKGDSELLNLKDEMLTQVNQTLYLFTFQK